MVGATNSDKRNSEWALCHHHKSSLPHQDPSIAKAAAEGALMGVEGAKFGPMSHQMVPPPRSDSAKQVSSSGVQIFLCLLGAILSASVSGWMAIFSKDTLGRRTLISLVALMCAVIFIIISYAAFKKRKRKVPVDDIEISQSIIREHRKSMTNSLRKGTANGDELIRQIRRHSSVIAIDHARQQMLQMQHEAAKAGKQHLLSADSPQKLKRASTSD